MLRQRGSSRLLLGGTVGVDPIPASLGLLLQTQPHTSVLPNYHTPISFSSIQVRYKSSNSRYNPFEKHDPQFYERTPLDYKRKREPKEEPNRLFQSDSEPDLQPTLLYDVTKSKFNGFDKTVATTQSKYLHELNEWRTLSRQNIKSGVVDRLKDDVSRDLFLWSKFMDEIHKNQPNNEFETEEYDDDIEDPPHHNVKTQPSLLNHTSISGFLDEYINVYMESPDYALDEEHIMKKVQKVKGGLAATLLGHTTDTVDDEQIIARQNEVTTATTTTKSDSGNSQTTRTPLPSTKISTKLKPAQVSTFDLNYADIIDSLSNNNLHDQLRQQSCQYLENYLSKFLPDIKLFVYGSSYTGLASKTADCDISIRGVMPLHPKDGAMPYYGDERLSNRHETIQYIIEEQLCKHVRLGAHNSFYDQFIRSAQVDTRGEEHHRRKRMGIRRIGEHVRSFIYECYQKMTKSTKKPSFVNTMPSSHGSNFSWKFSEDRDVTLEVLSGTKIRVPLIHMQLPLSYMPHGRDNGIAKTGTSSQSSSSVAVKINSNKNNRNNQNSSSSSEPVFTRTVEQLSNTTATRVHKLQDLLHRYVKHYAATTTTTTTTAVSDDGVASSQYSGVDMEECLKLYVLLMSVIHHSNTNPSSTENHHTAISMNDVRLDSIKRLLSLQHKSVDTTTVDGEGESSVVNETELLIHDIITHCTKAYLANRVPLSMATTQPAPSDNANITLSLSDNMTRYPIPCYSSYNDSLHIYNHHQMVIELCKVFNKDLFSSVSNRHYDNTAIVNENNNNTTNNNNNNNIKNMPLKSDVDGFMSALEDLLSGMDHKTKSTTNPDATPPSMVLSSLSSIACDLSLNNTLGELNSQLLRCYLSLDPRAIPLCMLFKEWAIENDLHGAKVHKLSSYALTLMVVYFLQQSHIIPNLQKFSAVSHVGKPLTPEIKARKDNWNQIFDYNRQTDCNNNKYVVNDQLAGFYLPNDLHGCGSHHNQSIVTLFHQLIAFYAKFDFTNTVISIRSTVKLHPTYKEMYHWDTSNLYAHGDSFGSLTRAEDKAKYKKDQVILIEDPLDVYHNLSRQCNVSYFKSFHYALNKTRCQLDVFVPQFEAARTSYRDSVGVYNDIMHQLCAQRASNTFLLRFPLPWDHTSNTTTLTRNYPGTESLVNMISHSFSSLYSKHMTEYLKARRKAKTSRIKAQKAAKSTPIPEGPHSDLYDESEFATTTPVNVVHPASSSSPKMNQYNVDVFVQKPSPPPSSSFELPKEPIPTIKQTRRKRLTPSLSRKDAVLPTGWKFVDMCSTSQITGAELCRNEHGLILPLSLILNQGVKQL